MKYLFWLIKTILFLALFAFALGNQQNATVNFLFGHSLTLPLVVIVLASFALGAVLGVAVMLPRWWKVRRSARGAQQQLREVRDTQAASSSATVQATGEAAVAPDLERHKTDPSLPLQP